MSTIGNMNQLPEQAIDRVASYFQALAEPTRLRILNLLRELQDHLGVSYLFVTHNIGVVAYLADRVAVMHAGEMVEMGEASQILNNPQHAYTKSLLSAVPQLNTALS